MKKILVALTLTGIISSSAFAGSCTYSSDLNGHWEYTCTEGALKHGFDHNLKSGSALLAFIKAAEKSGMEMTNFKHEVTQSVFKFRTP